MRDVVFLGFAAFFLALCGLLEAFGLATKNASCRRWGLRCGLAGWLTLLAMVAWLWITLGRPPIRTQGETRLLCAAWLPAIALFARWRWRTDVLLLPMATMALVFLILDLALPEARMKALMPALQSPWFVPHVVVYMASYAILALASLLAGALLLRRRMGRRDAPEMLSLPHRLLLLGFPLLTLGIVVGALWAKTAWGAFWTWDPKETWAFLTWVFYLVPLHQRVRRLDKRSLWPPFLGFPLILLCWFGVNFLPTAIQSLHAYMS